MMTTIPRVDAGADRQLVAEAVLAAGNTAGALQVTGAAELAALSVRVLDLTDAIFNLPDERLAQLRSPTGSAHRGWNSYQDDAGRRTFDRLSFAQFDGAADAIRAGASQSHAALFDHVNVWPNPDFQELVKRFRAAADQLCHDLLVAVCPELGLPSSVFDTVGAEYTNLSLTRYQPRPMADPADSLSYVSHRDASFATLLTEQGEAGCLQVRGHDGEWCTVDPTPDAVLVIFGTLAERVTSGRLRACPHRVLTPAHGPRLSTAVFRCAGLRTPIRPPAGRPIVFDDPENERTVGDHYLRFAELSLP